MSPSSRYSGSMNSRGRSVVFALFVVGGCSAAEPSDAERFAGLVEACTGWNSVHPEELTLIRAGHLRWLGQSPLSASEIDCLLGVHSCAAFDACVGFSVTPVTACEATARCEGDVAVLCAEPVVGAGYVEARDDCAQQGLRCLPGRSFGVTCGIGACTEVGSSCVSPTLEARCDGTVLTVLPCPPGLTCEEGLGCRGTPCTASRCEGSVAHECRADLGTSGGTQDCSALGRRCVDGVCIPVDDACDYLADRPTCDGDAVVYCTFAGHYDRYDCTAVLDGGGCADGACVPDA